MTGLEFDIVKLKDDMFVFLASRGFSTSRFHLSIMLTRDELKRVSELYPEHSIKNGNSELVLVSGSQGERQWTIQLLAEMRMAD